MTFLLSGLGVVILSLGVVLINVVVYCSRKASCVVAVGNEEETSLETSASQDIIFYRVRPNSIEKQNNSDYCKITFPHNDSDVRSSPQYEELPMQKRLYNTGWSSDLGTFNEVTVATENTTTYAEPFQHTMKTSEIYAVPYDYSTPNKEDNGILYENMLHSKSNDDIPSYDIPVRNSLYSSS
jgi:hypothetical protein